MTSSSTWCKSSPNWTTSLRLSDPSTRISHLLSLTQLCFQINFHKRKVSKRDNKNCSLNPWLHRATCPTRPDPLEPTVTWSDNNNNTNSSSMSMRCQPHPAAEVPPTSWTRNVEASATKEAFQISWSALNSWTATTKKEAKETSLSGHSHSSATTSSETKIKCQTNATLPEACMEQIPRKCFSHWWPSVTPQALLILSQSGSLTIETECFKHSS